MTAGPPGGHATRRATGVRHHEGQKASHIHGISLGSKAEAGVICPEASEKKHASTAAASPTPASPQQSKPHTEKRARDGDGSDQRTERANSNGERLEHGCPLHHIWLCKKHEESGATSDQKAVDGGGRHQRGGKATSATQRRECRMRSAVRRVTRNGRPNEAWRAREAGRSEGNSTRSGAKAESRRRVCVASSIPVNRGWERGA